MRIIVCDQCGHQSQSHQVEYLGPGFTWLVVEANEDTDHGQFCSWACLAGWATQRMMARETAGQ